ncbi:prepilin-type N-terminal cleavage/methylation domain-containing protein [Halarcobacter sp.]|uniref:prepilin-type N-terminal cleavage/methylation domain-containing protein n=1 Tax=Halarcobacter sp. TaxID=2321133 RepID=UPI002AA7F5DB|nr:prepilin-type N-terminal cleavage/methylation domain-containing protein [Halarcobacter sp.]
MKPAFSLMELIFAIVIIGIISTFAIPKYMNTRNQALASTIQRDVISTINSLQSSYLINRKIDNISDVITLNSKNWKIENKKITFFEDENKCLELLIIDKKISLTVIEDAGDVCSELVNRGITTQEIDLI